MCSTKTLTRHVSSLGDVSLGGVSVPDPPHLGPPVLHHGLVLGDAHLLAVHDTRALGARPGADDMRVNIGVEAFSPLHWPVTNCSSAKWIVLM